MDRIVGRGTTPRLTYRLPFPVADIAESYITVQQRGATVLEYALADCEVGEDSISAHLTQTDTLALDPEHTVKIQLRVRTVLGEAMRTEITSVSVGRILKDGEI